MQIVKYASHNCTKCKILDKVFQYVSLPVELETIYIEDIGEKEAMKLGIMSLPTLVFSEEGKEDIKLTGAILPKDIEDAITTMQT